MRAPTTIAADVLALVSQKDALEAEMAEKLKDHRAVSVLF